MSLEWYGQVNDGIIIGPDIGDVDRDGTPEIVFSLYDPDAQTSTISCISYLDVTAVGSTPPASVLLGRNYPNPFNPTTSIPVNLEKSVNGTVAVYDAGGKLVRTLISGNLPAGRSSLVWDGKDDQGRSMSSGVYLARLQAGDYSATRKMVLVQ